MAMVGHMAQQFSGATVVPATLVREAPGGVVQSIADLQQKGEVLVPLTRGEHIVSGGFAHQIVRGPSVIPGDQRCQFSRTDNTFFAFVTWNPLERLRGHVLWRIFNSENRILTESTPE